MAKQQVPSSVMPHMTLHAKNEIVRDPASTLKLSYQCAFNEAFSQFLACIFVLKRGINYSLTGIA